MRKAEIVEREQLKDRIKLGILDTQSELKKLHRKQSLSGLELCRRRSQSIDRLIEQCLEGMGFANLSGISIVALGGYGREEFSPYSDVDLLFLYEPDKSQLAADLVQKVLLLLLDLKLDVGHSARTIDECLELSQGDDVTILTALLDGRFICGDETLFALLDRKLYRELLPSISTRYIERKIAENEKRINRFGRSVYLLEPHIKEGEGGIRDINAALWIAKAKFKVRNFQQLVHKGILLENELRMFNKGLDSLLTIRAELHYLAERREDRLTFEWQDKVAAFMGYRNVDEIPAVERFMRAYYLRASLTREYSNKLIERCTVKPKTRFGPIRTVNLDNGFINQGGMLSVSSRDIFEGRPENMIRAFEIADRYGIEMSKYLKELIHDSVKLIDDGVRRNPNFNAAFLRFLKEGTNVADALFEMNRLRLLGYFIPEFGKIVCMVQHDAYHVYTVDVHSIFMVKEIENLVKGKYEEEFSALTKVARGLAKRHILYLACLFHDMGKGEGRNHAQRGADMVSRIAERMTLPAEDTEQLEYMVKQHLIMPHFSQRRDLHDESLIVKFAKSVKIMDTLSMLYLLSFADIRSVGPGVWTNWKGMLLRELYLKTAAVLKMGDFKKQRPEERAKKFIRDVVKIIKGEIPEDKVKARLETVPLSYFPGFTPRKAAHHVKFMEKHGANTGMDVIFHPKEDYDEFLFWGYDIPGIFSRLCGVVAGSGINILGARIITLSDRRILDVFYVNRLGASTSEDREIWNKVKLDLISVLAGKLDVEEIVAKRKRLKSNFEKVIPKHPTKLEIDNDSSDHYTVIDIYAHDRVGLLYDITKTIKKLGLSTNYAKISTKVDQVADVFYVRDADDKKVLDRARLDLIKTSLLEAINDGQ
ncbi:MAG: [protein-PII] uridylyltransferase [Deltaproteobacteria bacterium]